LLSSNLFQILATLTYKSRLMNASVNETIVTKTEAGSGNITSPNLYKLNISLIHTAVNLMSDELYVVCNEFDVSGVICVTGWTTIK
jgi:hypothetical protein